MMIGAQEVDPVDLGIVVVAVMVMMLAILEMKHRFYIKMFGEPARKMFEEDGVL